MITTILTIHLAFVALYISSLIAVGAASIRKQAIPRAVKAAYASFGTIVISGIGLVAVSPKAIAHLCVSALAATLVGVVVAKVYNRRVIAFHAA